jgi:hypothetical protein
MALPAVLSAFRQLVLDGIDLPDTPAGRASLYKSRFTGLSPEEVEDLSKMEPERLALYTTSVFSAEGGILKSAFPLSLAIIEAKWSESRGKFSPAKVARLVHKAAPWRGIHSMSLGESFGVFVRQECAEILESNPELGDAIRLEQATLEIRRAPNEEVPAQSPKVLERLSHLQVEALLEREVFIPNLIRSLTLGYDIIPVRRDLIESGRLSECSKKDAVVVGARPQEYGVLWVETNPHIAAFLSERRGGCVSLGQIAEVFLDGVQQSTDEEAFRAFYALVHELIGVGAMSLSDHRT